jgi:fructose-1,6-bisphosphatase
MNERWKDLIKQAIQEIGPEDKPSKEETLKRYAESIVKECAKVLTQHGSYFSGEGEPYHYAASLIEEHFGVEE